MYVPGGGGDVGTYQCRKLGPYMYICGIISPANDELCA